MILDQGMAVVIDLHRRATSNSVTRSGFVEQFAVLLAALAKHYSSWDTERVFFEVLNEPEFSDRYRWLWRGN